MPLGGPAFRGNDQMLNVYKGQHTISFKKNLRDNAFFGGLPELRSLREGHFHGVVVNSSRSGLGCAQSVKP